MSEGDQKRLFEVFREAVVRPVEQRSEFVRKSGLSDSERSLVHDLLEADEANESCLPEPVWDAKVVLGKVNKHPWVSDDPGFSGRKIGRYSLKSELGRGGMGVVYLAMQEGTDRLVALKCLRPGFRTEKLVQRFEQEVQILGRLDHPGIAKIFDAGIVELDGTPVHFFAMEYVRGQNLLDFLRTRNLHLREKIKLIAEIGRAIQHAHEQGVVHRDIKPGNILVTKEGKPKVLDFGVSRVLDRDLQLTTLATEAGQLIGTLSYMSPEQAGGDQREVGEASDVYALGVITYEMISGELPHDLRERTLLSAVRAIRDEVTVPLARLLPALPVDVGTIVDKAMELQTKDRYKSAAAMVDDLDRFLRHEPILARPASTMDATIKFVRRHRQLVGSLGAILIILLCATVFSFGWALDAEDARRVAEWGGYRTQLNLSESELRGGHLARAQESLNAVPEEQRGWEWRYLDRRADQSQTEIRGHWLLVWSVALSPGANVAYSCSGDASLRAWDTRTGKQIGLIEDHGAPVFSVDTSPDGQFVASGSRDVRLRDSTTLEPVATIEGHEGAIHGLSFSHNSELLASGDSHGGLRLSDGRTGHELRAWTGHVGFVWEVVFSPNDTVLATGCDKGLVKLWDVETGKELAHLDSAVGGLNAMRFTPDGHQIAIGGKDGALRLLDSSTLEIQQHSPAQSAAIHDLVYTPDGAWIITASQDRTIAIWDADSLELVTRLRGHTDTVASLCIDPDTGTLISGSWDQSLRIWSRDFLKRSLISYPINDVVDFAWGSDPETFYTYSSRSDVQSRSLYSGLIRTSMANLPAGSTELRTFAHGGALIRHSLEAPRDGTANSISVQYLNGKKVSLQGQPARFCGLLQEAQVLWQSELENSIRSFDTRTGKELWRLSGDIGEAMVVDVDTENKWIAAAGSGRFEVQVWDQATLEKTAVLSRHANDIEDLEFSPSGQWLVSGSEDSTAQVWRCGPWEKVATLKGHGGGSVRVAFHPDEERLATVSDAGRVHIWSVGSWDLVLSIELPPGLGGAHKIAFTADGEQLFVSMQNGLHLLDCR
jgi:WD40 repeat protein/predicted Ser/Thr protein kinase